MSAIYRLSLIVLSAVMVSCSGGGSKTDQQNAADKPVRISVDESFQPVIADQLKVFDSSYPDLRLQVEYKQEAACINDFLNDSATLVLVTRPLSKEEEDYCAAKKMVPTSLAIAKDAIAVIVHRDSPDTLLTLSRIRGMLTGRYPGQYTLVFDHQGSSTVRYILDSLLGEDTLNTAHIYAAGSNDSVLTYVAGNPQAFGFVGVSHTADYSDPAGLAFIQKVKVTGIYNDSLQKYYLPYQAYIAPGWYPMTRTLYYIHRETAPGPGTGFANFLSRERGQLIFKQARLFPLRSNIIFREAGVNTNIQ